MRFCRLYPFLFYFLFFDVFILKAQINGVQSFDFLSIPSFSRSIGLGGFHLSASPTYDVNSFTANPALLNGQSSGVFSFNYSNWYAGISNSQVAGVLSVPYLGNLGVALQYLSYGSFVQTTVNQQIVGNFQAPHFAFTLSWADLTKGAFRFGMNLKFAHSQIQSFSSSAILVDLGASFIHPEKEFVLGFVVKNIGFALSDYTATPFVMPLDIQLGMTYHPPNMPLRFSLSAHHLNQFDILGVRNTTTQNRLLNAKNTELGFLDKLASHLVIGAELLLSRRLEVRIAYNYWQRVELKSIYQKGLTGFAFGFLLNVKKIRFEYAHLVQNPSRNLHNISLTLNLKETFGL